MFFDYDIKIQKNYDLIDFNQKHYNKFDVNLLLISKIIIFLINLIAKLKQRETKH
jgi:hypothetical protein